MIMSMFEFTFHTRQNELLIEFLREQFNIISLKNNSDKQDFCLDDKKQEFCLSGISNSKIRRLIISGNIKINGKIVRIPSFKISKYSTVKLFIKPEKFLQEKKVNDIKFELTKENVLFEDNYIIIVNKPAFLPSESTFVKTRDNMHSAVIRYLQNSNNSDPYCGIMHRLDRETSGVLLFTKQQIVNAPFHNMFQNREIKKTYYTICTSIKKTETYDSLSEKFSVKKYIGRISSKSDKAKWGEVPESQGGVFSHTDFEILQKDSIFTLNCTENSICSNNASKYIKPQQINILRLKASLQTGKTHQIRVHLSLSGLPILGDTLYGGLSYQRIMLHAESLEFIHPITNEKLVIEAPLPDIFK